MSSKRERCCKYVFMFKYLNPTTNKKHWPWRKRRNAPQSLFFFFFVTCGFLVFFFGFSALFVLELCALNLTSSIRSLTRRGYATRAPCRWVPCPAGSPVRKRCESKWFWSIRPCPCGGWHKYFICPLRWFLNKLVDDRCIQISRKLWSCEGTDSIEKLFRTQWPAGYLKKISFSCCIIHTRPPKLNGNKEKIFIFLLSSIRREGRWFLTRISEFCSLETHSWGVYSLQSNQSHK